MATTQTMHTLRAERDGLLLRDRKTKQSPAWKARYRFLTDELNRRAAASRRERWAKLTK